MHTAVSSLWSGLGCEQAFGSCASTELYLPRMRFMHLSTSLTSALALLWWTHAQIGLLNINGFYDTLLKFFTHCVEQVSDVRFNKVSIVCT